MLTRWALVIVWSVFCAFLPTPEFLMLWMVFVGTIFIDPQGTWG